MKKKFRIFILLALCIICLGLNLSPVSAYADTVNPLKISTATEENYLYIFCDYSDFDDSQNLVVQTSLLVNGVEIPTDYDSYSSTFSAAIIDDGSYKSIYAKIYYQSPDSTITNTLLSNEFKLNDKVSVYDIVKKVLVVSIIIAFIIYLITGIKSKMKTPLEKIKIFMKSEIDVLHNAMNIQNEKQERKRIIRELSHIKKESKTFINILTPLNIENLGQYNYLINHVRELYRISGSMTAIVGGLSRQDLRVNTGKLIEKSLQKVYKSANELDVAYKKHDELGKTNYILFNTHEFDSKDKCQKYLNDHLQ